MSAIFKDIAELQQFVKVNANASMDDFYPYIEQAKAIFLEKYLGVAFVHSVETYAAGSRQTTPSKDALLSALLPLVQMALAPLAMKIGIDELSIGIGSAGHTVAKTDKLLPASDAKIEKVTQSFDLRGHKALDALLAHCETKRSELADAGIVLPAKPTGFVTDVEQFESIGSVSIDGSNLIFKSLLSAIKIVAATDISRMIGRTLYLELLSNPDNPTLSAEKKALVALIRAYIPPVVLLLAGVKSSDFAQVEPSEMAIKQLVEQATADIIAYIGDNATALGLDAAIDWRENSKEKKIFIA